MKKEWNKEDRWALAAKLEGIISTDIDLDEEEALRDAIRLVCPEYAAMRDDDETDAVAWDQNTTSEQKAAFVSAEIKKMQKGGKQ